MLSKRKISAYHMDTMLYDQYVKFKNGYDVENN